MNNVQSGSTTSKKRVRGQDCTGLVKNLMEDIDLGDSSPKKSKKKDAEASPSNISAVHDGASPSPVQSKLSSNPQDPITISSPNDQKGATESSIVMKRLKDLCSMKAPTVNMGIEIVGAAYLLKLMNKSSSCDHKIDLAVKHAVEATKQLFHADQLRNNALQQLSKTQELFDELL